MPPVAPLSEIHIPTGDDRTESWTRATTLLETCSADELLSGDLSADMLLYRLFHDEGIRVYAPHSLEAKCRCSDAKVRSVLVGIPATELDTLTEDDGKIHAVCEFCRTEYLFDPAHLSS